MSPTQRLPSSPLPLRVFLASPGDVVDERALALRVLGRLPYDTFLRGRVTLEAVAWDHPGAGVPLQAGIAAQDSVILSLGKPSECDIVVVILWSRLGTPLPDANYAKPDGSGNFTGTEWEYENAWQAFRKTRDRPRILLYRRTARPLAEITPANLDVIRRRCEQMQQVEEFFTASHARDGSFPNSYENPSNFEQALEKHLNEVIRQLLESYRPAVEPVTPSPPPAEQAVWEGSPFPGLRTFMPEDAPIFFGRGRETDGLVSRLGNPTLRFLAVVGASGSGKSSLVAAGLIPRLMAGAIVGSQDWAWVRFTPGEVGDNPFMALAVPFKDALQRHGQPPRELAQQLETNPATLVELRDLALAGKPDWAELLLFIDQFEELFKLVASRYVSPFIEWLHQAAQTDRIRVVTTLRADFYHRCVEWPALAELLRTGSFPLALPSVGALYEMIVRPAERAELTFEAGLVEQLLSDTGQEPGSLPLLEFALAELYNARTANGQLTQAAYENFQGIKGAIAQRAETTFTSIPNATQQVLGKVFQALVKVDEQGTWTRQRAWRERVSKSAGAAQLVDALIAARLLVASRDGDNRAIVEVAHEALLMNWPRLKQWIGDTQDDLRLLSLFRRDVAEWERKCRAEDYRWSARRRFQAMQVVKRLQPDLTDVERLFLATEATEQDRLVDEFNEPATTPQRRVAIGIRLAETGDFRPGIGLQPNGLPDLLWVQIPGTATVRTNSRFPDFTGFRLGNGARPDPDPDAGSDENWPEEAAPLEIKAFELAIYPVTAVQFRPFVEQGGYREERYWSKTGREWREWRDRKGWEPTRLWDNPTSTLTNHPVIGVSWYEVEAYCNWLNEQLHWLPGTIRLPTEAEWEWVARGPEGRRYPWGDKWEIWCCNGGQQFGVTRTSAVGCFPGGAANWWRVLQSDSEVIHDLAGNVWEWTASAYSEDYSTAHQSVLNANSGGPCVLRGGSWNRASFWLRGAARFWDDPLNGYLFGGFRLARTFPFTL